MLESVDKVHRYRYGDYRSWYHSECCELIDGYKYRHLLGGTAHAGVSLRLSMLLLDRMRKVGYGGVLYQSLPIRIPVGDESSMDDINTVVSPDISILADVSKLDASGYVGVPSLSIEILSISSYLYDLRIKYSLYERVGVSEYWIVFPVDGAIHIFTLDASGKYGDGIVYERGSVPIGILGGELLELSDIFKR